MTQQTRLRSAAGEPSRNLAKRKCKSSPPAWVYILRCADHTLYTGAAKLLERRMGEHTAGRASRYTRGRLPVRLVYYEACGSWPEALRREFRIKQMTHQQKKLLVKHGSEKA